jgi:dTDP-4-amino-4,6-dideoxygalactose transaminase
MHSDTTSPLAIHGGTPLRDTENNPWPAWPIHDETERAGLLDVLESGDWWYGERVKQFEKSFAALQDAAHCVSVTSGTTAGDLCVEAAGIGPGDEVIVPPYSFIATATAVMRAGATPVFVDIDDSWNLNPALIEDAITERTKAIMPVHFGGRVADMDAINAIATARGLRVIEDACHSWGSKWKGKGTGTLGDCGFFSFQASKNMTAGEGGAIVTDDAELAERCRSLSNSGRVEGAEWYYHYHVATNARLTEFAAALLNAQLARLPEQNTTRAKNAAILDSALSEIEGISIQTGDDRITARTYHIYCLRMDPDAFGCSRDQLVKALNAEGLPISPGYPHPLYKQPIFREPLGGHDYAKVNCPVCEDLCYRSALWFRHSVLLGTEDDIAQIAAMFAKVKEHVARLA